MSRGCARRSGGPAPHRANGKARYPGLVARVFLVTPRSPEPVRSPLLSVCHLAASLRARGHAVALYDASAPAAARDVDAIAARIDAFGADVVGLHLKTLHVQPAYGLARALGERWPLV